MSRESSTASEDAANENFASDTVSGYAVDVIALQVPIAMLTSTGKVEPPNFSTRHDRNLGHDCAARIDQRLLRPPWTAGIPGGRRAPAASPNPKTAGATFSQVQALEIR